MDDNEFASAIVKKTITSLKSSDEDFKSYSNIFDTLLSEDKMSNSKEIYKAIVKGVEEQ